jgi:hypothetical protein
MVKEWKMGNQFVASERDSVLHAARKAGRKEVERDGTRKRTEIGNKVGRMQMETKNLYE